jgi:hypothetical protein
LTWFEDLERNHFNLSVFGTRRTFLSGVLVGPPRTTSYGSRIGFSRDITPLLLGTLRGAYTTSQELGGSARIFSAGGELRYSLTREMQISFRGDYLDRHSSRELVALSPFTGSLSDYRFTLYVSHTF